MGEWLVVPSRALRSFFRVSIFLRFRVFAPMKSFVLRLSVIFALLSPWLVSAQTPGTMAPGAFVPDATADAPGGADYTPTPSTVATDPAHVLQPQDMIRVEIFQENDLNKQCDGLSISQDSTVTLPLIGTISVKDQTVQQAQKLITALYNKDYLVDPQVTVTIIKYADRTVNVVGSVTKQGRIDFPPARPLSIIDAISLAGGQTRLADLKHVRLTHTKPNGETQVREIDVDALMKHGGSDAVMLQPGDIVYVPERML